MKRITLAILMALAFIIPVILSTQNQALAQDPCFKFQCVEGGTECGVGCVTQEICVGREFVTPPPPFAIPFIALQMICRDFCGLSGGIIQCEDPTI
jgi:hypothetical protein